MRGKTSGRPKTAGRDATPERITDFISGEQVRATREEMEAVQVFARRLVEDYGYGKNQIRTRPQYRVRRRPSDSARSYPVDIAVFQAAEHTESQLTMIIECKTNDRHDGEHQLRLYMGMSSAEVGVWFNGRDHIYLRKVVRKDGRRTFEHLPNIPRNGQRIEDIGLHLRKDLVRPSNLKAVFRDIRNHLAGMTTGITRDEALAQEIAARFAAWRRDPSGFEPDRKGFLLSRESVANSVLIPRYYNPIGDEIARLSTDYRFVALDEIARLSTDYRFVALGDLVEQGAVSFDTGVEVGKMAYGTGTIPFIRTSDISNWEVKADFKHGVSEDIYGELQPKADVRAGDILMVKDGTYLIGTSAVITEFDLPMLYQSHLYRIRVLDRESMDPWLLFALLNTRVVDLQVRAKQFTQDIIDTIGKRVFEVMIPVPLCGERASEIADRCRRIIETRVRLREEARALVGSIGAVGSASTEPDAPPR